MEPVVQRIRWPNVVAATAVVGLSIAVIAWPHGGSGASALPSPEPVPQRSSPPTREFEPAPKMAEKPRQRAHPTRSPKKPTRKRATPKPKHHRVAGKRPAPSVSPARPTVAPAAPAPAPPARSAPAGPSEFVFG